jgi:hypothetical protein
MHKFVKIIAMSANGQIIVVIMLGSANYIINPLASERMRQYQNYLSQE